MGTTRRRFLGTAAVAAAGAAVPAVARAGATRLERSADVVVVGAGLAGLTAARALVRAGRSVVVLEARDRVGGRTWTVQRGGTFVDVGGQFVGPTQKRLLALARALDVKTFAPYVGGVNLFEIDGAVKRWTNAPPFPKADVSEWLLQTAALEEIAKTLPRTTPWTAQDAVHADGMTFASWLEANVSRPGARRLFNIFERVHNSVELSELSLLGTLFGMKVAPEGEEPEKWRFVGGAQQISIRAAAALGDRVLLSRPVRAIRQTGAGVIVQTDEGRFTGKRVIVAVPPTLAGRIDYEPALPALNDGLMQRLPQAAVVKVQAVYGRPFWRERGLSGTAWRDRDPMVFLADNSPPDGSRGVLLGFVPANAARRWSATPIATRRRTALEIFAKLYGREAGSPLAYIEGDWSAERWTRGCYQGVFPPGALTVYGPVVGKPVGRIHWASTETSFEWYGYMDGAVRSGERAAREADAAL